MAQSTKKRPWRRDRRVANPYRDSLRQEIGYKMDSRVAGCLLFVLALALLTVAGVSFLAYWFTR